VKGTEMLRRLWAETDRDLCRGDMVIPEAYYIEWNKEGSK